MLSREELAAELRALVEEGDEFGEPLILGDDLAALLDLDVPHAEVTGITTDEPTSETCDFPTDADCTPVKI